MHSPLNSWSDVAKYLGTVFGDFYVQNVYVHSDGRDEDEMLHRQMGRSHTRTVMQFLSSNI